MSLIELAGRLETIAVELSIHRLPADTETSLQAAIGETLTAAGIPFAAEHRLDPGSRIDFFCDGIGIEAKIRGGRLAIWRQLERYACFNEIRALIMIGSVAMPTGVTRCGGKPFRFVSLGKAWL